MEPFCRLINNDNLFLHFPQNNYLCQTSLRFIYIISRSITKPWLYKTSRCVRFCHVLRYSAHDLFCTVTYNSYIRNYIIALFSILVSQNWLLKPFEELDRRISNLAETITSSLSKEIILSRRNHKINQFYKRIAHYKEDKNEYHSIYGCGVF
jgi:hypothetical protein